MTQLKEYLDPDIYEILQNLDEKARSKAQRRIFGMALAYKRGELDNKYISQEIKKMANSMSEEKLREFAKTNEKRRKKDGSIGKRNALPNYTRDGKDYKTNPDLKKNKI